MRYSTCRACLLKSCKYFVADTPCASPSALRHQRALRGRSFWLHGAGGPPSQFYLRPRPVALARGCKPRSSRNAKIRFPSVHALVFVPKLGQHGRRDRFTRVYSALLAGKRFQQTALARGLLLNKRAMGSSRHHVVGYSQQWVYPETRSSVDNAHALAGGDGAQVGITLSLNSTSVSLPAPHTLQTLHTRSITVPLLAHSNTGTTSQSSRAKSAALSLCTTGTIESISSPNKRSRMDGWSRRAYGWLGSVPLFEYFSIASPWAPQSFDLGFIMPVRSFSRPSRGQSTRYALLPLFRCGSVAVGSAGLWPCL